MKNHDLSVINCPLVLINDKPVKTETCKLTTKRYPNKKIYWEEVLTEDNVFDKNITKFFDKRCDDFLNEEGNITTYKSLTEEKKKKLKNIIIDDIKKFNITHVYNVKEQVLYDSDNTECSIVIEYMVRGCSVTEDHTLSEGEQPLDSKNIKDEKLDYYANMVNNGNEEK